MGYFHHATAIFRDVHSSKNPLGLRHPDWSRARALLWGGHRGLLFYAPIVALAIPGWAVLVARRWWGMATVSAAAVAAVFLVNLSYPEWTGGWSPAPGCSSRCSRSRCCRWPPCWGGRRAVIVGGGPPGAGRRRPDAALPGRRARSPGPILDPIRWFALPIWRGDPNTEARLASNLISLLVPGALGASPRAGGGCSSSPSCWRRRRRSPCSTVTSGLQNPKVDRSPCSSLKGLVHSRRSETTAELDNRGKKPAAPLMFFPLIVLPGFLTWENWEAARYSGSQCRKRKRTFSLPLFEGKRIEISSATATAFRGNMG